MPSGLNHTRRHLLQTQKTSFQRCISRLFRSDQEWGGERLGHSLATNSTLQCIFLYSPRAWPLYTWPTCEANRLVSRLVEKGAGGDGPMKLRYRQWPMEMVLKGAPFRAVSNGSPKKSRMAAKYLHFGTTEITNPSVSPPNQQSKPACAREAGEIQREYPQ